MILVLALSQMGLKYNPYGHEAVYGIEPKSTVGESVPLCMDLSYKSPLPRLWLCCDFSVSYLKAPT